MTPFCRFKHPGSSARIFDSEDFALPDDVADLEKAVARASDNAIEIWDDTRPVALVRIEVAQLRAQEQEPL